MKYEVVDIVFGHPSFSWADGRYFIIKADYDYEMCKLDYNRGTKKWEPQTYDDGRYMTSHTGLGNTGIKKTKYVWNTDTQSLEKNQLFFRKDKLERILKDE